MEHYIVKTRTPLLNSPSHDASPLGWKEPGDLVFVAGGAGSFLEVHAEGALRYVLASDVALADAAIYRTPETIDHKDRPFARVSFFCWSAAIILAVLVLTGLAASTLGRCDVWEPAPGEECSQGQGLLLLLTLATWLLGIPLFLLNLLVLAIFVLLDVIVPWAFRPERNG